MALSIFLALVLALQGGMAKALHPWVKRSRWRALNWALLALNLPMLAYVGLRALHIAPETLALLRPMARFGLYLQALALCVMAWSGLTLLVWRLRGRTSPEENAPENPARRAFLRRSAFLGVGTAAATTFVGAREAYGDPQITRKQIAFPDLPAGLVGLRLVFLSDLHAGPLIGEGQLRRWRDLAEREKPDLLLFGGDFVDSLPEQLAPLIAAFDGFRPSLGAFAVLGNHDYFTDPRPIWRDLETSGIRCLENAHAVIERGGAKLGLIGLQDPMAENGGFRRERFGPGPRPFEAIRGLPDDAFRLCLAHRPGMHEHALAAGARLTLSGHTHGGQINPIPFVSSARLLGPYTEGLFDIGPAKLYVGRGLGVVGLPLRIQAPPEIVVITLAKR
ncbi:MAG: metallophosphoesterase [Acidobacteria bacterium]|nr:metallophosphoesterase [Acidobacteriota bacterium]